VIEDALEILASRFHVFHHSLMVSTQNADLIYKAALVLYNLLRKLESNWPASKLFAGLSKVNRLARRRQQLVWWEMSLFL